MSQQALALADANGGIWGEYPKYPVEDWRNAVASGDTRQSYWDWVLSEIDAE